MSRESTTQTDTIMKTLTTNPLSRGAETCGGPRDYVSLFSLSLQGVGVWWWNILGVAIGLHDSADREWRETQVTRRRDAGQNYRAGLPLMSRETAKGKGSSRWLCHGDPGGQGRATRLATGRRTQRRLRRQEARRHQDPEATRDERVFVDKCTGRRKR